MKPVKDGKGNDQKPKPILGNSKNVHGRTDVDYAGGQGPGPVKVKKGK